MTAIEDFHRAVAGIDLSETPMMTSLRKGRSLGPPVIGWEPAAHPVKAWAARRAITVLAWAHWQAQRIADRLMAAHNDAVWREARWGPTPIYDPDPKYRQRITWGMASFPKTVRMGDADD